MLLSRRLLRLREIQDGNAVRISLVIRYAVQGLDGIAAGALVIAAYPPHQPDALPLRVKAFVEAAPIWLLPSGELLSRLPRSQFCVLDRACRVMAAEA